MERSPLVLCPSCDRHVRSNEPHCPFCRSQLASREAGSLLMPRVSRAALWAFTAAVSVGACNKSEPASPSTAAEPAPQTPGSNAESELPKPPVPPVVNPPAPQPVVVAPPAPQPQPIQATRYGLPPQPTVVTPPPTPPTNAVMRYGMAPRPHPIAAPRYGMAPRPNNVSRYGGPPSPSTGTLGELKKDRT